MSFKLDHATRRTGFKRSRCSATICPDSTRAEFRRRNATGVDAPLKLRNIDVNIENFQNRCDSSADLIRFPLQSAARPTDS
jgi:hypothetical protein